MAVQLRDESGQGRAPGIGEVGFADVLGRRLRRVEAERLEPVELEYDGEEAVRERLRVPAPAGG